MKFDIYSEFMPKNQNIKLDLILIDLIYGHKTDAYQPF